MAETTPIRTDKAHRKVADSERNSNYTTVVSLINPLIDAPPKPPPRYYQNSLYVDTNGSASSTTKECDELSTTYQHSVPSHDGETDFQEFSHQQQQQQQHQQQRPHIQSDHLYPNRPSTSLRGSYYYVPQQHLSLQDKTSDFEYANFRVQPRRTCAASPCRCLALILFLLFCYYLQRPEAEHHSKIVVGISFVPPAKGIQPEGARFGLNGNRYNIQGSNSTSSKDPLPPSVPGESSTLLNDTKSIAFPDSPQTAPPLN